MLLYEIIERKSPPDFKRVVIGEKTTREKKTAGDVNERFFFATYFLAFWFN